MKLIRNEWEVYQIHLMDAVDFVSENHYSNSVGRVATSTFGLFYKGDRTTLHGVAVWNTPVVGAAKYVSGGDHRRVLALSRFCLVPGRPENAGSFLISRSIRGLDNRWNMLLTYADTALNHDGGLYRAANWNYFGLTSKNPMWWDPVNNCMVSRKSGKNNYSNSQMLEMGYEFKGRFAKHRFIYPRVNRRNIIINPRGKDLDFTEDGRINLIK